MKKLMARVNPNLWYVMLLLGAMAASGSAGLGVCGWTMP